RDDLGTVYRFRIGGADRGDRSDLHRAFGMDHGNGTPTNANHGDGACRWFCWGGNAVRTGPASSLPKRTKSCDRNIDSACHKFYLVGGLALLARCETRPFAISHRRSTNDLRRIFAFAYKRYHRGTAAVS